MTALDRISPALARSWALRLWCTPPHSSARRRDDRPGTGRLEQLDTPAGRIVTETWGLPGARPPVYLLHGWGGWRGQLGAFVEPLLDAGHRVVLFDVPGHGESGPGHLGTGQSSLLDFSRGLTEVVARHGAPAGVIAHSLGCCAAALAIRDGLPVPRLGFVGPNADPLDRTREFARIAGFGERTRRWLVNRVERLAERPAADFLVPKLTTVTHPPPTRIVHDRADNEVPYAEGVAIASAWPEADLVITDGLGHQRILRDTDAVDAIVSFVVDTGQPAARAGTASAPDAR